MSRSSLALTVRIFRGTLLRIHQRLQRVATKAPFLRSFAPAVFLHRPPCVLADRVAVGLVGLALAGRLVEGGIVAHVHAPIARVMLAEFRPRVQ